MPECEHKDFETCAHCGAPFAATPGEKYCSAFCRHVARKRANRVSAAHARLKERREP